MAYLLTESNAWQPEQTFNNSYESGASWHPVEIAFTQDFNYTNLLHILLNIYQICRKYAIMW